MTYNEIIAPFLIDFDELIVGQKIWSVLHGEIQIFDLDKTDHECAICIADHVWYDSHGKGFHKDKYPTLLTSNPFEKLVKADSKKIWNKPHVNFEKVENLQLVNELKNNPIEVEKEANNYIDSLLNDYKIPFEYAKIVCKAFIDGRSKIDPTVRENRTLQIESLEAEAEKYVQREYPNLKSRAILIMCFKDGAEFAQKSTQKEVEREVLVFEKETNLWIKRVLIKTMSDNRAVCWVNADSVEKSKDYSGTSVYEVWKETQEKTFDKNRTLIFVKN